MWKKLCCDFLLCYSCLLSRWAWTRSTTRRCSPTTTPSLQTSRSLWRPLMHLVQLRGTGEMMKLQGLWNVSFKCLGNWQMDWATCHIKGHSNILWRISRQKFGCHRLLLSIASPYFRDRLRNHEDKCFPLNNTNPEAFKKVVDFIYHKRRFKIQNGDPGSSYTYIKLVLEVLCLATKFQLHKLVKYCEEVAHAKIMLTSANSEQVCCPSNSFHFPHKVAICCVVCIKVFCGLKQSQSIAGERLPSLPRGCHSGGQEWLAVEVQICGEAHPLIWPTQPIVPQCRCVPSNDDRVPSPSIVVLSASRSASPSSSGWLFLSLAQSFSICSFILPAAGASICLPWSSVFPCLSSASVDSSVSYQHFRGSRGETCNWLLIPCCYWCYTSNSQSVCV